MVVKCSTRLSSSLSQVLLLLGALHAVVAYAAPSNEEVAAKVRGIREQYARDPQAVLAAKALCQNLPPARAMEELRCVALARHIAATATRSASGVPRF